MTLHILQSKYVFYVGVAYLGGCFSLSALAGLVYFKHRQIQHYLKERVK